MTRFTKAVYWAAKCLTSGCAVGMLWTSLAHAQVTVDMSKLNCNQFYFSKLDTKALSMWLSGFYHGKSSTTVVDVQKLKDNAEKLGKFCRQNENSSVLVMDAVERVFGGQK